MFMCIAVFIIVVVVDDTVVDDDYDKWNGMRIIMIMVMIRKTGIMSSICMIIT